MTNRCCYMCVMSLPGSNGPASVKYFHCPEGVNEEYCKKHGNFERLMKEYQDAGDDPAAASWKAHTVLDIPTAYSISGNVRAWEEKYQPEKYKKTIERELAFLIETGKIKEPEPEQETEARQISIDELLTEVFGIDND